MALRTRTFKVFPYIQTYMHTYGTYKHTCIHTCSVNKSSFYYHTHTLTHAPMNVVCPLLCFNQPPLSLLNKPPPLSLSLSLSPECLYGRTHTPSLSPPLSLFTAGQRFLHQSRRAYITTQAALSPSCASPSGRLSASTPSYLHTHTHTHTAMNSRMCISR
jgi:hypothetical protein